MNMMSNFVDEFEEDDDQFQSSAIFDSTAADGSTSRPANTSSSKKKRSLPGNPDPDAEVVALSPRTLMATNRYICEVCHKGFQRDQNLQLHRRGHNLPWKLKQRGSSSTLQAQPKKRVFVCPEPNCVHHHPSRALGDLTGIKKHFCRKHGDKKWKCDKCSKRYAVQSDWKAHSKICGSREYRCDCATVFSRKDSFVTHRAFCDALTDAATHNNLFSSSSSNSQDLRPICMPFIGNNINHDQYPFYTATATTDPTLPLALASAHTSATALLQMAAEMGSKTSAPSSTSLSPILLRGYFNGGRSVGVGSSNANLDMGLYDLSVFMNSSADNSVLREQEKMTTVDFLGVAPSDCSNKTKYGQSLQDMHDDHQ